LDVVKRSESTLEHVSSENCHLVGDLFTK
jgi:hypothetical protein